MNEIKECPFCGSDKIESREDKAKKGFFKGNLYIFTKCAICGAQGPHAWKVDKNDDESFEYSMKLWNERMYDGSSDWIQFRSFKKRINECQDQKKT